MIYAACILLGILIGICLSASIYWRVQEGLKL